MGEPLQFDYYYGIEAEQFSFYRVPRLLIKDERFKGLSSDAKLLYGLMLDRMALSMKNGWLDDDNRAYIIYTIDNMMEDLGCSKPTCIKILRELDTDTGIGLIEKKRRGLGKPDIIYVKNFATIHNGEEEKKPATPDNSTEGKNFDFREEKDLTSGSKEIELPEVKNFYFKKERTLTSGSKRNELPEVKETSPIYTDNNQTDQSYTKSINQSDQWEGNLEPPDGSGLMDGIDESEKYMALIRENIEYDNFMSSGERSQSEIFDEIYEIICDIVCVNRKSVRIGKEDYPYGLVKARFLKLKRSHVDYVMWCCAILKL